MIWRPSSRSFKASFRITPTVLVSSSRDLFISRTRMRVDSLLTRVLWSSASTPRTTSTPFQEVTKNCGRSMPTTRVISNPIWSTAIPSGRNLSSRSLPSSHVCFSRILLLLSTMSSSLFGNSWSFSFKKLPRPLQSFAILTAWFSETMEIPSWMS